MLLSISGFLIYVPWQGSRLLLVLIHLSGDVGLTLYLYHTWNTHSHTIALITFLVNLGNIGLSHLKPSLQPFASKSMNLSDRPTSPPPLPSPNPPRNGISFIFRAAGIAGEQIFD